MRRLYIATVLIALATTARGQEFTGQHLHRLCQTNAPACGDFIRRTLKDAGWPEQVPFEAMTRRRKSLEWLACPTIQTDAYLATAFAGRQQLLSQTGPSISAKKAAIIAMTDLQPECARSIQH